MSTSFGHFFKKKKFSKIFSASAKASLYLYGAEVSLYLYGGVEAYVSMTPTFQTCLYGVAMSYTN
jgi:uncharacterized membrane protein SpoIIM required for sporulation